jgi:hydroxymethylglutaryl-CoA lyase
VKVRGYVSCVIECPYDGPTDPLDVRKVCDSLRDIGIDELDLGDTVGVATPDSISRLYEGLSETCTPSESVLHLHNTNGRALDCARRAFALGVRRFDASCGGLGGCPFAPGASGNLSTESLVEFLDEVDGPTGVDLPALIRVGASMRARLGRQGSPE